MSNTLWNSHMWNRRMAVRESVVVHERGDHFRFTCLANMRVKEFTAPLLLADLIRHLDGSESLAHVADELRGLEGFSESWFCSVIETLENERLLARAVRRGATESKINERQGNFFSDLIDHYDTLPDDPVVLHQRLREAKVVLVGVGGAGSHIAQLLAMAGVGSLVLVDPDTVESSNLDRQVLYNVADVGLQKVIVARRKLEQMVEHLRVSVFPQHVSCAEDVQRIGAGASLIINCADEPDLLTASDIVAEAGHTLGVPHIVGGAYGSNLGILGTSVIPGVTACWQCIRRQSTVDVLIPGYTPLRGRRTKGGAFSPVTGWISSMMAWEATRLILGLPPLLAASVQEINFLDLRLGGTTFDPMKDCPRCAGICAREVRGDQIL